MGYIYKITNKVNNKLYIGQTKQDSIYSRFEDHIKCAKNHVNRYLYDAMNHYGYENFTVELIEECANNQLDNREIYYISYFHTYIGDPECWGYNMTAGGGGGNTWTTNPHKEETGKKISEKNTGKKRNAEICEKLSATRQDLAKKHYEERLNSLPSSLILDMVENSGMTINEIADYFNITYSDIIFVCKRLKNTTPRYLRKTPVKVINYKIKDKESYNKAHFRGKGKDNPSFKEIEDWDKVEELFQSEMLLTEIAKILGLSAPTLSNRILEHYNLNVREFRKFVKLRRNNVK